MTTPDVLRQPQAVAKAATAAKRSLGRPANWTVGIAAAALVLISVSGYFYHREQLWAMAAEHLRLIVTGPSRLQAGVTAQYTINTTAINGQPLPAHIDVTLSGPRGERLKAYREPANDHGQLLVEIPADLLLPREVKLKVLALHRDSREEMEMPIRVEAATAITRLVLDKPFFTAGETMRYRSLTLSSLALPLGRERQVRFTIRNSEDVVVPGSTRDVVTEHGVAHGAFAIPADLAAGTYRLAAESLDGLFPSQHQVFRVSPALSAATTPALPAATANDVSSIAAQPASTEANGSDPADVQVSFHPEGGELAADLENRVYVVARDKSGRPLQLAGMVVAGNPVSGPGKDDEPAETGGHGEDVVALVKTIHDGLGAFSFIPQLGESYRFRVASPRNSKKMFELPQVTNERDIVLSTGTSVFAADAALEFNIRAAKARLPLVAAAYCRGVQVGQQLLVTRETDIGANPVAITLDPDIAGVLQLIVYDYRSGPPKPVATRLVYRHRARKLNIQVSGVQEHYAQNADVRLSLSVTNARGEPVPAVISATAADAALTDLWGSRMVATPTYFLLASRMARPGALDHADFYLSNGVKDGVSATVALDLLLGAETVQCGKIEPPLMFDNLSQIRSDYEKTLADYQADHTRALDTLTTASFLGGLGLVLLVAMLGLMGIVSGMHLWIPALGATTCCLIIGAILTDPARLATEQDIATAFSSFSLPTGSAALSVDPERNHMSLPKKAGTPGGKENCEGNEDAMAPQMPSRALDAPKNSDAVVFWDPVVVTGPDGRASLRFKLPQRSATYRLTLEAHGAGGIGMNQIEILALLHLPLPAPPKAPPHHPQGRFAL
jgi:hypothetical protein